MPTLWSMLKNKVEPTESKIYNPLNLRIRSSALMLNVLELKGLFFKVSGIREVARHYNDEDFKFVDYDITARELDKDPVAYRLRLLPLDNPDHDLTHNVLLLRKLGDDMAYDKEFEDGLAYDKNDGEFTEGDATYWRVNDIKTEWVAKTTYLKDSDNDGIIDIRKGSLTYWDFWRDTKDEGQNPVQDFYFVEKNENGMFQFWTGPKIDPVQVTAM